MIDVNLEQLTESQDGLSLQLLTTLKYKVNDQWIQYQIHISYIIHYTPNTCNSPGVWGWLFYSPVKKCEWYY